MLVPVPSAYLKSVWPTVAPLLDSFLSNQDVFGTINNIYEDLLTDKKVLWVDLEEDEILFSLITSTEVSSSGSKALHITNTGSKEGLSYEQIPFKDYLLVLEAYAKAAGYDCVISSTRTGLVKEHTDYKYLCSQLIKRL